MLTTSQLKTVFSRYGFRPLKRLGQNYLIDDNIKANVINSLALSKGDSVLEIGPGLGALTIDLALSGASVYAIEKDKKAFAILKDIVKEDFPNLALFNGDILEFDFAKIPAPKKITVVGNLPYYITTPIIEYLIDRREKISSIFVTVQKELAHRLLAEPGTKNYGAISCFVQFYMKPAYLFSIHKDSFYPVPEVDSCLIRLDVLEKPSVEVKDEVFFFKIVRGAFNQRRKSIINSLSREAVLDRQKGGLSEILAGIDIDPHCRPESLSLSEFAKISNTLSQ